MEQHERDAATAHDVLVWALSNLERVRLRLLEVREATTHGDGATKLIDSQRPLRRAMITSLGTLAGGCPDVLAATPVAHRGDAPVEAALPANVSGAALAEWLLRVDGAIAGSLERAAQAAPHPLARELLREAAASVRAGPLL